MTRVKTVLSVLLVLSAPTLAQSPEEFAQRRYESGRAFYDSGRYGEALKDFQAVIDSYAATSFADDALMDVATYHLDIAGDPGAAGEAIDLLLKKYPNADSAPMALVMQGRITLATGVSTEAVDAAVANFDRVPRLFPATSAVPAAMYFSGRALLIGNRLDEARERYARVASEYPSSIWAVRARAGMAICFTLAGNATRAMQELQRIRVVAPATREAATALAWNSILYRLYVRPPQPAYALSKRVIMGAAGKIRDAEALAIDGSNQLFVVHRQTVQAFDPKGGLGPSTRAVGANGLFFDSRGVPVVIDQASLSPVGGQPIALSVPQTGKEPRVVRESPAGVAVSTGDFLISDPDPKEVHRFSSTGKYIGRFTSIAPDRMVIDLLDNVAALERSAKAVTIFNRDGKQIGRIQAKGADYELREPVDIAYDALGHLYVLDRNRGTMFVFSNDGRRVVTSFTLPQKTPGALFRARALALDTAGRPHVFDDQLERIHIYQ